MFKFLLVILSAMSFASAAAPNCSFYSELELRFNCGSSGYPIGYGQKYCRKFLELKQLSTAGLKWRDQTLKCLQLELEYGYHSGEFKTCEELDNFAFDSHPACYTMASSSICKLPFSDWAVIASVPSAWDMISGKGRIQIAKVLSKCLGQSFSPKDRQLKARFIKGLSTN